MFRCRIDLARCALTSPTRVDARGLAWCADDRHQWQVPAQIRVDAGEGPPLALLGLEVRVGDAQFADLRSHSEWKPRTLDLPREWLYAFALEP